MPGCDDQLMACDDPEHRLERRRRDRHRPARNARGHELVLIFRQTGCFAGFGPSSLASFSESTVGSHTIRAPPRAAISTACAFSPPTPAFSAIAPRTSIPGTDARTTAARSAVGT